MVHVRVEDRGDLGSKSAFRAPAPRRQAAAWSAPAFGNGFARLARLAQYGSFRLTGLVVSRNSGTALAHGFPAAWPGAARAAFAPVGTVFVGSAAIGPGPVTTRPERIGFRFGTVGTIAEIHPVGEDHVLIVAEVFWRFRPGSCGRLRPARFVERPAVRRFGAEFPGCSIARTVATRACVGRSGSIFSGLAVARAFAIRACVGRSGGVFSGLAISRAFAIRA